MENRNSNNNNRRDEEECNWFTVSLTKYHLMNSNNHYSNKSTSSTNQDDLFDKLGRQFTELATDAMQSNTNYQLVKSNPIHELYVNKTSTIQTVAKTQLLSSPYSSCTPLSSVTTSLLNPDVLITDCRQKRPTNLASETVKSVERIKKERKSIREKYSGMDSGKDQEFKVKELANTTTRTIKTVTNASVDANSITHNLSTNCYPTQVVHPIVNRDERKKSSSSPLSSSSSTSTSASSSSSCTPTVTRKFTQKYKTMKTVDSEKVDSKILSIGLNEHLRRRDDNCV
ncbi:unnamed protein product [Heterobilharzia americana]|nr:unnamed protein product [Heterobilharzia americana]